MNLEHLLNEWARRTHEEKARLAKLETEPAAGETPDIYSEELRSVTLEFLRDLTPLPGRDY